MWSRKRQFHCILHAHTRKGLEVRFWLSPERVQWYTASLLWSWSDTCRCPDHADVWSWSDTCRCPDHADVWSWSDTCRCPDHADVSLISSVPQYLTVETTETLAGAFVPLKIVVIPFSLAAHFTLSTDDNKKRTLQRNLFSKHADVVMCNISSSDSSLATTVPARIDYKLSAICHYFFNSSPAYLSDLTVYTPSKQLCSEDSWTLHIPHYKTKTLVQCSFSYTVTVLQSNGILSLLTSSTFSPSMPSNLHKRLASKALRTKPQRFKILSFRPLCFYQDLAHEYARVGVGPWIG